MKVSLNEVSQSFDLGEIFGVDVIPDNVKTEFAELVIQEIQDRSLGGVDFRGKGFQEYSKEYAEFKGVSVGDVDMTLFGDMLDSLEYEIKGNTVKVKIGDDQTKKAYNLQYGDTLPQRAFFGVHNDEIRSIKNEFSDDIALANIAESDALSETVDELITDLFEFSFGENQE